MPENKPQPSKRQQLLRYRRAKKADIEKRRAAVKERYGRESARAIGERLGVSAEVIRNDAIVLGLTYRSLRQDRGPDKPKGFTRAQKAWAKANPTDPEARMIFAMMRG